MRDKFKEFVYEVDLLLADTQYTEQVFVDQPGKRGFGHPTMEEVIKYSGEAGVKVLIGTHHDPSETDELLHAKEAWGKEFARAEGFTGDFELARDGARYQI